MTDAQAQHIYKKVESEGTVNIDTIKQEIEDDKLVSNNIDEDEVNPYHEIITNKVEKENIITMQLEQYSVLSNIVNYVHYDRHYRNFCYLDIKTIDQKSHRKIYDKYKEEDRHILDIDFSDTSEKIERRLFRHVQRNSVRSDLMILPAWVHPPDNTTAKVIIILS